MTEPWTPPGGDANPGTPPPPPGYQPPAGYAPPQGFAGPAGARGPVGQQRAAVKTILLTIVTCGIWSLVWTYQNHEELKQYRRDGLGGGLALVIALIFSPVIMFLLPSEIEKLYQEDGRQSPVNAMIGLWVLLPLIGNIIWYLKVQEALNDFWASKGAPAAV